MNGVPAKDQTRLKIEKMEAEREERRRLMQERKLQRASEEQRNLAAGNPGDVDFIGLVKKWRAAHADSAKPIATGTKVDRICICVRKRPINDKERKKRDHDSITCLHPNVWVHNAKLRVDGITKYLDHNSFGFDCAFDEGNSTEDVYRHSTMHLVDFVCQGRGCRATVFAYGQTGSGKTYTMNAIQTMVAEDIFLLLSKHGSAVNEGGCSIEDTTVTVAFFELYGGRVQDLLNNRHRLKVLEDGKGEVVVSGLEEFEVNDPKQLLELIDSANRKRTTHATEANDTSSRSHAICQILLRDSESSKLRGKLSLVDLAGSERGSDTKSHNRQRRTESSEINTSLLALKECIRALDCGGRSAVRHVPYRASKLTLILKDCFMSGHARTSMIATVSPGASAVDHTLNTLRYADRIKEKKVDDTVEKSTESSTARKTRQNQQIQSSSAEANEGLDSDHQNQMHLEDDLDILHASLIKNNEEFSEENSTEESNADEVAQFHRTVKSLFEEEEALLNLHMSIIQENAELLTEEGKLLQGVQGDGIIDYDIDHYASRLGSILDRKAYLIGLLKEKLTSFHSQLEREEELSKKVVSLPTY